MADTHAVLWFLSGDSRLSAAARNFILDAAKSWLTIAISSISVVEIVYLVEKRRIPAEAYDEVMRTLADPDQVFSEVALTSAIAETMRIVARDEVPDLPDRVVAATALHLGVPVISRDRKILAADLRTIW